jgi:uncharacterized protein
VNGLGNATSPYLLQHKDNPVDWWEWGEEAFAEARRRDVPVLISVGYAACHWCHVMAHESFEDAGVAEVLNRGFVAIKVDREERPDVDAVYMTATQAMTGQGGWPMTVFATPSGEPFFCGTYYPREQFLRLLGAIGEAWSRQRDQVQDQAGQVAQALTGLLGSAVPAGAVDADLLDAAVTGLSGEFDEVNAGFGGAPKFPPSMVLLFLLRYHQRTGDERALEMVRHTAEQMARGGMYDQLGGGFARYSVDERWLVPHFEKMLYDNALLLRVYTMLWRLTGDPLAERVARQTFAFLHRDLRTAQGGLAASLDADTGGVEGATYAWTPGQLVNVLGEEDGGFAADLFGVTPTGTFEHGTSVLRLTRDVDDASPELRQRYDSVVARLLEARQQRPQPGRDDKVVAAWNGLAVVALVEFGFQAGDEQAGDDAAAQAWDLARSTGELLRGTHVVDGRLRRVSRDGAVGTPDGVLDDYGAVAEAFCALHQLTAEGSWLEAAGALLDTALAHFAGADGGGFYDTADFAESLVARPSDPTDNASPAGVSTLAAALTTYTALTGQVRYREAAEQALAGVSGVVAKYPRYAGYACAVAEAQLAGPYEIAVAGPDAELVAAAWRLAPPGAVVVAGAPDQPGVPLLASRPLVDGAAAAYVCRGFVCERPVTEARSLAAQLAGAASR